LLESLALAWEQLSYTQSVWLPPYYHTNNSISCGWRRRNGQQYQPEWRNKVFLAVLGLLMVPTWC
jgi:hypothetical protein